MSWRPNKNSYSIAAFKNALDAGKRVLYIAPRWVLMDCESWKDLNTKKHDSIFKTVVWDETAHLTDEEWLDAIKVLKRLGQKA